MAETKTNPSAEKAASELISRIITGEVKTFAAVREYLESAKLGLVTMKPYLTEIFQLIKQLNWGVFSTLNKDQFPKLWHELILTDEDTREYGDLKQYMMLSKIYVAILDIHGYTSFCEEKKINITMLQRLDSFISTKISQCALSYGVLACREMGDSVLLIGSEATAILAATFDIIALFSKERTVHLEGTVVMPDLFLPAFKISAGLAGGQPSNPLVITDKGSISGSLINSAARLQSRANYISPNETKVIAEQYVLHNFEKSQYKPAMLDKLSFFYNGEIAFKGISMKNYEVYLYNPSDHYKSKIQDFLTKLQDSIKENQWQTKVMANLCDLVSITAKSIPPFYVNMKVDKKPVHLTNQFVDAEFRAIKTLMCDLSDYQNAVERLGFITRAMEQCDAIDKLIIEYCHTIYETYQQPLTNYLGLLQDHLKQNAAQVFTPDETKVQQLYKQVEQSYNKVILTLHQGPHFKDKRMLFWYNAVESAKKDIDFKIYSGKK